MPAGKHILLGVTGGIAAYKAAELCRLFVRAGAQVKVIMTEAAEKFVTPLTFQTVSNHPVYRDLFSAVTHFNSEHIGLAAWADLFVIAPATANCIGKIAAGIADDLLTTTVMAARCPLLLAPAMNERMYENPVTQGNLARLAALGFKVAEPASGELACGVKGRGRLAPVEEIFAIAESLLKPNNTWQGYRFLITAGPTREALDPVRYLTNHSSGKMGYALAEAAGEQGGEVLLVTGPTNLMPPAGVNMIKVTSAGEMLTAVMDNYTWADVIIKAAAVADYRPSHQEEHKIKKGTDLTLTLVKNTDILSELGQRKGERFLAGFAAETRNVRENAWEKLQKKNLDMIVANDLTEEGAGFDVDTNIVRIICSDGTERVLPKMSKNAVAREILEEISKRYKKTGEVN